MSEKKQLPQASRWQDLSKAEQQQISQHLTAVKNGSDVKPAKKAANSFQLRGYVRCDLSTADKAAYLAWEQCQEGSALYGWLVKLMDSGYLVKAGDTGEGHQASLSANTTGMSWDGYVLVARASSSERALALVIYKHFILMEATWAAWTEETGDDFFR